MRTNSRANDRGMAASENERAHPDDMIFSVDALSLENLESVLQQVAQPAGITDENHVILWVNGTFSQYFGYDLHEVEGKHPREVLRPDDADPEIGRKVDDAVRSGKAIVGTETRLRHRCGESIWVEMDVVPYHLGEEDRRVNVVLLRVIEDRKNAEAERSMTMFRLRSVLDNAPMGYIQYELRGDDLVIVDMNRPAYSIFDLEPDVLEGKTLEEAFPALPQPKTHDMLEEVARFGGGEKFSDWQYTDDRISGVFETFIFQPYPKQVALFFREVSDDLEMSRQNALLREAIDNLDETVTLYDPEDRIVLYNSKFREMCEAVAPGMIDKASTYWEFTSGMLKHGAIKDAVDREGYWIDERRTARLAGNAQREIELSDGRILRLGDYVLKDGSRFTLSSNITNLKNIQTDLEETVRRYQGLFENSSDAILVYRNNVYADMNKRAEEMFGVTRAELIGTRVGRFIVEESIPEPKRRIDRFRMAREEGTLKRELKVRTASGEIRACESSLTFIGWDGDEGIYQNVVRDITEIKEAEEIRIQAQEDLERLVRERTQELQDTVQHLRDTQEQLIHQEKLASLGGLVAGITHEINTPVGVGITAVSHMQGAVKDLKVAMAEGTLSKSKFEQFIEDFSSGTDMVLSNLERAANLIRSFKQSSVDQSDEHVRMFEAKSYIESVLTSLMPTLKQAQTSMDIDIPATGEVCTDPGALAQVLTILVSNAVTHAFEGRDNRKVTITAVLDEDAFTIRFADNGNGMPKNVLAKIFDPFFTTKRGEGGSGLGLHILHTLVTSRMGGTVSVESTIGKGTLFELVLPRWQDPEEAEART